MNQTLASVTVLLILLMPVQAHDSSDHIEYNITINVDGSATWRIIQVTDIDSAIDSLEDFQQRLLTVINAVKESTSRDIALDASSLEMKTKVHWETSSQTIEHTFRWENFSAVKGSKIVFGDVFIDNLFSALYGDGELYITYPQGYVVNSVSMQPDGQSNSTQTLHWYRTQDLINAKSSITLIKSDASTNLPLTTLAATLSGVLTVLIVGFLLFSRRKQKKQNLLRNAEPPLWGGIENNEEKILKLLKSSGGSIRQSEICNKLKFSRAKTSLLLAKMEKNNQVKRDKQGKNKIVYILN
ncbi:MAG: helix-turn-helix domain-containing protein [Candidatus Bathyarchaeota archaeon]|nr:helix-turn-helix domain-containing protein [Candidatus Bathyarchaeota archaeon]